MFRTSPPDGGAITGQCEKSRSEVHLWHPGSLRVEFRWCRTNGAELSDTQDTHKVKNTLLAETLSPLFQVCLKVYVKGPLVTDGVFICETQWLVVLRVYSIGCWCVHTLLNFSN